MVAGIIQARMDSSRLPGKVMMDAGGTPLIGRVIARAKRIAGLDVLMLATTGRPVDRPLAEYASSQGVGVYTGDLEDVAGRMLACARGCGADYILRLNGDSPLLDPALAGEGIGLLADGAADMVSNLVGRTFPYGVSVEIIRTDSLALAWPGMSPAEREHVTQYFYSRMEGFSFRTMTSPWPELSRVRMVVDTADDLELFRRVSDALGDRALGAGYREAALAYLRLRSFS